MSKRENETLRAPCMKNHLIFHDARTPVGKKQAPIGQNVRAAFARSPVLLFMAARGEKTTHSR
jgi:hypothetical protein